MSSKVSSGMGLADFGLTEASEETPKATQRWICICGHPLSNHVQQKIDDWMCFPGNSFCPCRVSMPVIEVQDVRHFRCQTSGYGDRHAFGAGLRSANRKQKWFKTLGELICSSCRNPGGAKYPTAIDRNGFVVNRPTDLNVLLCKDCLASRLGYEPI